MSKTPPRARPAAGGVLWRPAEDSGAVQVALVHRPGYEDWTLPKGKLESGERTMLAAVREVDEETGSAVEVGRRLISVSYPFGGAIKTVSYWAMRHISGNHKPSAEVDRIQWLDVDQAAAKLSYAGDRAVLADFNRMPAATSTVLLIRHAKAGKRSDYRGDDRLRPLDKIGRRQARDAVPFMRAFAPAQVLSADRLRCVQTVAPLAAAIGLRPIECAEFSDDAYAAKPEATMQRLLEVARAGVTTAICSQGDAIPALLHDLKAPVPELNSRKGSLWVLSFDDTALLAADYYPRPQV